MSSRSWNGSSLVLPQKAHPPFPASWAYLQSPLQHLPGCLLPPPSHSYPLFLVWQAQRAGLKSYILLTCNYVSGVAIKICVVSWDWACTKRRASHISPHCRGVAGSQGWWQGLCLPPSGCLEPHGSQGHYTHACALLGDASVRSPLHKGQSLGLVMKVRRVGLNPPPRRDCGCEKGRNGVSSGKAET